MRSWYDFSDGTGIGKCAVKEFQVAFYENGKCYDEIFFSPEFALQALVHLGQETDNESCRVFVVFKDGEVYEMTAKEVKRDGF